VYRVTVTDTGCGIPFEHIPKLLGQVFGSTKTQAESGHSAGKFGIACKAILLYAASGGSLTSSELKVLTSTAAEGHISDVVMGFKDGAFGIITARRSLPAHPRCTRRGCDPPSTSQAPEEG
jgi:DNA topoisomerase VI subunit B